MPRILSLLRSMVPRGRVTLPIFPLNTVLFPGGVLRLRIFEQRYMDMAASCLRQQSTFGVCLIREGQEVGRPAVPEAVGCSARIIDWDMPQLGLLLLRTIGEQRFVIRSSADNGKGLLVGEVELIGPDDEPAAVAELEHCSVVLRKIIAGVGDQPFQKPYRYADASWVGNRLCEVLPLSLPIKQKLMELTDAAARLQLVAEFMRRQGLLS